MRTTTLCRVSVFAGLGFALLAGGCGRPDAPAERFALTIGTRGHTSGNFNRPRGIAYDDRNGVIFVVDWDGRIQKFSTNGQFRASWIMPEVQVGKPEDLCMATNGNLLVADTHYSRIVEFSPDGRLIRTFGSYGRAPGQFIYPVGICCDREGNIYVSEYGENDRIQKFNSNGGYICSWGGLGSAPGQFQRPSGIDLTTNNLLVVADAVNHRVQIFDATGKLCRIIGKEGAGPGEFRYPYDVAVRGDILYVLEFGNQRVQKLTLEGKPLASFGKPGSGEGCFASPWRCEIVENSLFVSDTDNNRVVKLEDSF